MPTAEELEGKVLHGDDFSLEQIEAWYRDEENAYAEMAGPSSEYDYGYEALNAINGFARLPRGTRFPTVVGLGSAYGDELRPIVDKIDKLVIIESADSYQKAPALAVETEWRKAAVSGDIDLPDGTADLITCFGTLHHIPNVSHVLAEMGRVTKPGGYALVREPVISMGDWSRPRPGLTPRERGIPRDYLVRACRAAGFEVLRESWCGFSVVGLLGRKLNTSLFNKPVWVRADRVLAGGFRWNYRYHARSRFQKVRPTSVFLVLRRAAA